MDIPDSHNKSVVITVRLHELALDIVRIFFWVCPEVDSICCFICQYLFYTSQQTNLVKQMLVFFQHSAINECTHNIFVVSIAKVVAIAFTQNLPHTVADRLSCIHIHYKNVVIGNSKRLRQIVQKLHSFVSSIFFSLTLTD